MRNALMVLLVCVFSIPIVAKATETVISGTINYGTPSTIPLKNCRIVIEARNGELFFTNEDRNMKTNSNGYFYQLLSWVPEEVIIRIAFKNELVEVQSYFNVRSTFFNFTKTTEVGSPDCPDEVPCDIFPDNRDFQNLSINLEGIESDYADIFTVACDAAEFAKANGYIQTKPCIIRYPSEETLVENSCGIVENLCDKQINNSFFWPFDTKEIPGDSDDFDLNDDKLLGFLQDYGLNEFIDYSVWTNILSEIFGYKLKLQANSIYLTRNYSHSTIHHEFGHFIIKDALNGWPISLVEYTRGDVPAMHNSDDNRQNTRLAYIEGWANFYGSASRGYSLGYDRNLENFKYSVYHVESEQGINHEYTVGNTLLDYFDYSRGLSNEEFSVSFSEMITTLRSSGSEFSTFINNMLINNSVTDLMRNTGIRILTENEIRFEDYYYPIEMEINTNKGFGTIEVNSVEKTLFNNRPVVIEDRWMNTKNLLILKPYTDGGYKYLPKDSDSTKTLNSWTTSFPYIFSRESRWENLYSQELTIIGNYDKYAKIYLKKQELESGYVFENTESEYITPKSVEVSAPEKIVRNEVEYHFQSWNDGVNNLTRTTHIDNHVYLTAYYKTMLTSRTPNWVQSQSQYSGNGKSAVIYKTEVNGETGVWLHSEVNGQKMEQGDFGTIDGVNVPLALAVTDYNHLRQYVAILHLDPSDHHLMAFEVINGISTNILDLNASNLELPSGLSQNAKLYISGYSAAVDYGGYPNGLLLVLVDGQTVYTAQSNNNGTNWGSFTGWSSFSVSGTPVFSTNGKYAYINWISNGNIVGRRYSKGSWGSTYTLFSNSGGNYTSFAASVNSTDDLVLLMIRGQQSSSNKQACYGKRYYSGGSSPVTVLESGLSYGNYKAWSVAVEGSKVLASIGKAPDGETWNYYLWKNDGTSWTKETSPFSASPARLLHNEVDEYPVEATIQPDGVTNLYALKTNLVSWPSGGPGMEKDGDETDGFSIVASRLGDTTETWITIDPSSLDSIVIDTLKVWNIAMKQTTTRDYLINHLNLVGSAVYVDSSATIRFIPAEARYTFYVVDPSGNKFRIRKSAIGEEESEPVLAASVSVFPNPFNPVTVLSVTMPEAGTARLTVYNILGQQVASLVNGHLNAGVHDLQFNASNLSSGTYLYRFEAGTSVKTGKLQLMK